MTITALIQVQTTTADQAEAERIARGLVERRVAACVQIVGPIRSYYRWKDRLETSEEWLCIAKTASERYKDVEHAIR
jgi:periplasmic divalent cation tolerance protein